MHPTVHVPIGLILPYKMTKCETVGEVNREKWTEVHGEKAQFVFLGIGSESVPWHFQFPSFLLAWEWEAQGNIYAALSWIVGKKALECTPEVRYLWSIYSTHWTYNLSTWWNHLVSHNDCYVQCCTRMQYIWIYDEVASNIDHGGLGNWLVKRFVDPEVSSPRTADRRIFVSGLFSGR